MAASIPAIIQGGMGVGISNWVLARAVSLRGQLGVVSGTALDSVLVRRLQDGDPGGNLRRAMDAFPIAAVAAEALRRYFKPGGRSPDEPYAMLSMYRQATSGFRNHLTVLANFVEVFLAKEGHHGLIGINYLTKIQLPTLASIYGAMLAGVDYILMGAGIPRDIPGTLDRLAEHKATAIQFDLKSKESDQAEQIRLAPAEMWDEMPAPLNRPRFLAIIASNSLGTMLARKANGQVDGFVVEGPTAGGHNAPPRGKKEYNGRNEPIYGDRDFVDLEKIAELGLPFWTAGGRGRPGEIAKTREAGGAGIQVGTLFAYCRESGLAEEYKARVLELCRNGSIDVITDDRASPTGFPFKTVLLKNTVADADSYAKRERVCDLGYLRVAVRSDDGGVVYRCAAEPVNQYVSKGGAVEDTTDRRCLCNSLLANIGLGQVRKDGSEELPLLTSGDDLKNLNDFLEGRTSYSASDVINYLLS